MATFDPLAGLDGPATIDDNTNMNMAQVASGATPSIVDPTIVARQKALQTPDSSIIPPEPKGPLDVQPNLQEIDTEKKKADYEGQVVPGVSIANPLFIPEAIGNLAKTAVTSFYNNTTLGRVMTQAELVKYDPVQGYDDTARETFIKQNNIPPEYQSQFYLSQSPQESDAKLMALHAKQADDQIMSYKMKGSPITTILASGLGSMFDVDTAIAGFAGPMLKAIRGGVAGEALLEGATNVGREGRILSASKGALLGGTSLAASQFIGDQADITPPSSEAASVLGALVAGAGFGAVSGALFGHGGKPAKPEEDLNYHGQTAGEELAVHQTQADEMPYNKGDPLAQKAANTTEDTYGSIAREKAIEQERIAREEAAKATVSAAPEGAKPKPQTFDIRDVDLGPSDPIDGLPSSDPTHEFGNTGSGSSAGAAQVNPSPNGSANTFGDDAALSAKIDAADKRATQIDSDNQYFDGMRTGPLADTINNGGFNPHLVSIAQKFHEAVRKIPGLRTDYDKLMFSGSTLLKNAAYDLFENASGLLRNNTSAAALKMTYLNDMLGNFRDPWQSAWNQYAQARGQGWFKAQFNAKMKQEFHEEVVSELQARKYDGNTYSPSTNPHVTAAADIADRYFAGEIPILKGYATEHSVYGSDDLQASKGFFPQRWSPTKINQIVNETPGKKLTKAVGAIASSMMAVNPAMLAKDADTYAHAVVAYALSRGEGMAVHPAAMLAAGGENAIRALLSRNGVSYAQIERIINVIVGRKEEMGLAGTLRKRVDVDLRTVHNGTRLMDMVETDVPKVIFHRAHGVSGTAALARKGFRSREDVDQFIADAMKEQQFRDQPSPTVKTGVKLEDWSGNAQDWLDQNKKLSEQDLRDIFSAFTPNAEALNTRGASGAVLRRMIRTSNLMILNQNGLSQLAETGPLISMAGGFHKFMDHAGPAFQSVLKNKDSELIRDLKHMNTMVPEENIMDATLWDSLDGVGKPDVDMTSQLDRVLNLGMRGQGWWSGMFHVRRIQQAIAVTSMADRIMRNLAGYANDLTPQRLNDFGLSNSALAQGTTRPDFIGPQPKTLDTIRKYIENGTIQFMDQSGNIKTGMAAAQDPNITLHKLNTDKWHFAALQDFKTALNRGANNAIQRAMAGETNSYMSKNGIASLFMHLKTYPITAVQKQFIRQANLGDVESRHTFLWALGMAGVAYTAKQIVNGRTDNLTPSKIAAGSVNMSNIAGWFPMAWDPLAGMLGMPQFNQYGSQQADVVGAPAVFTLGNDALRSIASAKNLIGAPFGLTKFSNSDLRTLKTVMGPITNWYGISAILNGLYKDNKGDRPLLKAFTADGVKPTLTPQDLSEQ